MSDKQEFEKYPALTEIIQHFAAHVPVDLRMWSNFLEEINNALQAASQPPAVKGLQWVKASEFQHSISEIYFAKIGAIKGTGHFARSGNFIWEDESGETLKHRHHDLYILDESPTAAGDGEAREMIENILYATGKFFEEQCTELADIILKEIKGAGDGKEAKYDELYRLVYSNLAKLRARTQHADRLVAKHSDIRAIIEDVTKQMQAMPQPDSVVSPFQPFETNTMNFRGSSSHCKACEDEAAGIKHITSAKHTCRKQQNK